MNKIDKQVLEAIDLLSVNDAREALKSLYEEYIAERDYYSNGSLCSIAESIHGEDISNKVLKLIRDLIQ